MPELSPLLKQAPLVRHPRLARPEQPRSPRPAPSYVDFLARLVADEVSRREQKKFRLRLRRAGFRSTKASEQFDQPPGINPAVVQDLSTCRFVDEHASVLIAGPCGTGKSDLAQGLGHCAARAGG